MILSSFSSNTINKAVPTPNKRALNAELIIAELLPAATPPATGLKIISRRLILPFMIQVKLIDVTTQAEMQ